MTAPTIVAGASGYSFRDWRGAFYPADIKHGEMLSFYRLPDAAMLEGWANATPERFSFAIMAPRGITHTARLQCDEAAQPLQLLYRNLAALGPRRGPVLFQLPPNLKKDLPRLTDFLALLPEGHGAAFEFRDDTWFADDVFEALREVGAALCVSEREGRPPPPLVETAPWGYVRLRLQRYSDEELRQWAGTLAATGWKQVHVYFTHDPAAPGYAQALMSPRAQVAR